MSDQNKITFAILPLVLNLCQIDKKEHPCQHFAEQVIHGENPGHVIF